MTKRALSQIANAMRSIATSPARYKVTTAPKRLANVATWRAVDLLESKKILPKKQANRIRAAIQMQQIDDMGGTGSMSLTKPFGSLKSQKVTNIIPDIKPSNRNIDQLKSAYESRAEKIKKLPNRQFNEDIVLLPKSLPSVQNYAPLIDSDLLPTNKRRQKLFDRYLDLHQQTPYISSSKDPILQEMLDEKQKRLIDYSRFLDKERGVERKLQSQYRNARRVGAGVLGIAALGAGAKLLDKNKNVNKRQRTNKYM